MLKWLKMSAALLIVVCLSVLASTQTGPSGLLSRRAFAQQDVRRENRTKALAYWKRADARRKKKRYEDAAQDYEKSAQCWETAGNRRFAQVTRQMVELCNAMPLDLKKLKDGTHTGSSRGYTANVELAVKLQSGKIKTLEVTSQRESRPRKALEIVPRLIVKRQSPSVDTATGATITSYALMCATSKALEKAKPDAAE